LFCGARDWSDKKKIWARVKNLTQDDLIIEGGAPGADFISGVCADVAGIPHCTFRANWNFYCKAAGSVRNGWMLKFGQPDKVVAFHSNIAQSKGTADMVRRAKKAGVPVEVVR
jgi:hypothetical protein